MYRLTRTDTMTKEIRLHMRLQKKLKAVVENECLPYI